MSGSVNSNFTYDGNLRRVKQVVNGETIYSIYDKSGAILTQHNVTTNIKTDYLTVAGQTFVRIKNGTAFYPLSDHLGTAFMEADQNGSVAANKTYNYTPFGETTNHVPFGSAGNDPGNNIEQGFTGHIEDKSGLTYMQARYYDPVVGRFLSTDPIGYEDGLNVYAYVGNDPVNKIDPDGMQCFSMSGVSGSTCDFTGGQKQDAKLPEVSTGATVGGSVGAVVGVAASIACDGVTVGVCAAGNPAIIGGSTAIGAIVGHEIERAFVQLERLIAKATTSGPIETQYALVTTRSGYFPDVRKGVTFMNAGEIWKYGTTVDPSSRYSASALVSLGLSLQVEAVGTRYQVLAQEKMKLIGYAVAYGELPPGNRIFK